MYPFLNNIWPSAKVLAVWLKKIVSIFSHKHIGKFSLIIFLLLGIFYPNIVYAIKIGSATVTTSEIFVASFSLNSGDFQGRSNIFPDRVFFNASGTTHSFTPSDFVNEFDWQTNYPVSSWEHKIIASSTAAVFYENSLQIKQFPDDFTEVALRGALLTSSMRLAGNHDISAIIYPDDTDLLKIPSSVRMNVTTAPNPSKPHAMVISRTRAYFFWLDGLNNLNIRTYNGSSWSAETIIPASGINNTYGVSGCLLRDGSDEYIAIAFPTSLTSISIISFKDGEFPTTDTLANLNLVKIDGSQVSITQNPRDRKVYISWLNVDKVYYKSGTFNPADSPRFSFSPANTSVSLTDAFTIAGATVGGYDNFATDFILPIAAGMKNFYLKGTNIVAGNTLPPVGYSTQFPYTEGNDRYIGLLTLSAFSKFDFYRRKLEFPDECSWQNPQKTLHIEGPPLLNTQVRAEVDFAEVVPGDSLGRAVNSSGGYRPLNSAYRMIASASVNQFMIKFDKSMRTGSYSVLIHNPALINDAVKMLAPDASMVNLTLTASTPTELFFMPDNNLQLDATYTINIASSVIDANGSQIYEDKILTFTTQTSSSQVLESEILGITAYSDPARTLPIASGSEVNASATIYLRLEAVDPAFNTIDNASIRVVLNDAEPGIATITLTQTVASSNFFYGSYTLSAPTGGNNFFKFKSLKDSVYHPVEVKFPTLISVTPADSSTDALINSKPQLTFSENLLAASVTPSTVRLNIGGSPANFSVSLIGNVITIDPNDTSESYLRTETLYQIAAGYGIRDLAGNPFISSPATFTSSFTTQNSQTPALSIATMSFYNDAGFSNEIQPGSDYPATSTLYIQFNGVDGQNLTRDYTIASISTGQTAVLTEIASASGIYQGSITFAGLSDRFSLKVQSVTSPAASASLLITYPALTPTTPASGAVNIPVNSSIRIQADEPLQAASITAANVKLMRNGVPVAASLSYNVLLREITIAPAALLISESKYIVSVDNLTDLHGNPQLKPLIYSFTIEDKTPPTIINWYPPDTSTGITIDRQLTIDFSEIISPASVDTVSVKLTRNGFLASYSLTITAARLIISPDDSPEHGLLTAANYNLEISNGINDLAGNSLANVPEPFKLSFSTQPAHTPPASINNLSLYKDPLLITSWNSFEKIPASTTVYLKATGIDGATQTRDLATVTLKLSWGPAFQAILRETASNSTGIYIGSFSFSTIPLYGIPLPQPAVSSGLLTFSTEQAPDNAATLTISFPELLPLQTIVNSISGEIPAANASNVKIESPVILTFSDELTDEGSIATLRISSGAVDIAAQRTLSSDRRQITITPLAALPLASTITVSADYSDSGLKSILGNPLFRPFTLGFSTQASETQPVSISQINLFPDASMSALNPYVANQDFIRTGTLYIEAIGNDAAANTVDSTIVSISTGATVRLVETAVNSGIFHGSYNYFNLADGFVFNVSSVVSPAASQTLKLSIPALSPFQPASGAVNVSNYTVIRVICNEPLNPDSVNNSTFKFFKGSTPVAGTLSYLPGDNIIEFIPAQALDYNGDYNYLINGVKDPAGNTSTSNLIVSFKVQASSVAPVTINSIKAFSDNNFSTQLTDGFTIAPSSQIFLEISAVDQSAATTDATQVIVSTSISGNTISTALIETAPNSGLFRGSITLPADENATLTLSSSTNPAVKTTLVTYSYPRFVSLQPASGSTNLYLDTIFYIETSKTIDAATLSNSTIILANQGIASYQITLTAPNKIKITSELKPSEILHLRATSQLKDADGLPFPELLAQYSTLTPSVKEFRLYADASFLSPLNDGAEVEAGQTVFARLIASNSWQTKPETATATFSDGLATTSFTLNEAFPGIFTASFVVPESPDRQLTVTPENLPDMTVTLSILPGFTVSSISPASAAVNVPADVWPSWTFTRQVRPADVNAINCKLIRLPDMSTVSVSFSISPSGKQIRMQPDGLLPLLTKFEMQLNQALHDTNGNILDRSFSTTFITQPPPLPPSDILSLRNYETADYATPTMTVAVDGSLYLELVAKDTSFSTYDTARVRVDSSDSTLDGLELTLIEMSPPSGIYRLSLPINLPPGTTIRIQSQAAPAFIIEVSAQLRTRLVNITPASNSTGLYLDSPIALTFSQPIDSATLNSGVQIIASAGQQIPFNSTFSGTGQIVTLTPQSAYASATRHTMTINTSLRDINGLYLLPQSLYFSTRSETNATFDLLTGLPPLDGQAVSVTGEAVRGPIVLVASTTDMFSIYPETRSIKFTAATRTFEITLNESEPGSFNGDFIFPEDTATEVLATLAFGNKPSLAFKLAATPQLLALSPASGSSDIGELPVINASFSRKISYNSAVDALKIVVPDGSIIANALMDPATNSLSISWLPATVLPVESSCTLQISGLTDYLGQPITDYQHVFSTGGRQGISIYSDNAFAQLIATNQISISQLYVEIAASGTQGLVGQSFMLEARTGTHATETIKLLVEPISTQSGLFRCSLNIIPGKAVPEYPLALLPGEWLELTAPLLTDDRKLLYYRHATSAGPVNISDIRFYSEKNYVQKAVDVLTNPSLYIEAEAEDLNWFTSDSTRVKITSDSDLTGFSLDLQENGTHSSSFRNFIRISPTTTDKTSQTLKVLPDQRIYVVSETSPAIRASIRYLPENGLKHIAVFPSPARGDSATFRFYLNFAADVSLEIYDAAGEEVKGFTIRGQEGENNFRWHFPKHLANGVYFYQMRIDNLTGYPTGKRKERGKFAVLR